ncbi:unnamed protein product [Polarella glacialis]|uniref:JmjC domain-containing protein n=1 Tax=Polarella glacialis TaxID=89957 RepID=A0A813G2T0_POLGL|nr:unnamed protein product [Polarella glacialis]
MAKAKKAGAQKLPAVKPVSRLAVDATPEEFLEFYLRREPVIIPDVTRNWPAREGWDLDGCRQFVCKHACDVPVELAMYQFDAPDGTRYKDLELSSVSKYFEYIDRCIHKNMEQKSALKNGVNVPRDAISSVCPVPAVLKELHDSGKLKLRDLAGRQFSRLFISLKGFHGRCHYDRFGYPFFSVQIKGSKTWYLYSADALPMKRAVPFDNAPFEDFCVPSVRNEYAGWVAELNEGDMLFLPPYTYHSVCHTGQFNVNIDYACLPDLCWAEAVNSLPLALQDVGGMLGGRALMFYALPKLLPDSLACKRVQAKLLSGVFELEDLGLVLNSSIFAELNAEEESTEELLSRALAASEKSAAGAGTAALLLESCLACEAAMRTPHDVLLALCFLTRNLIADKQLVELMNSLRIVKDTILEDCSGLEGKILSKGRVGPPPSEAEVVAAERAAARSLGEEFSEKSPSLRMMRDFVKVLSEPVVKARFWPDVISVEGAA